MANRIPTYVDATSEKISEVPAGDFLSIEGSGLAEGYTALTGATPSLSLSAGGSFSLTLSANTTLSLADAPDTGSPGVSWKFTQGSGGSGFTVTWLAAVQGPGGAAAELPDTAREVEGAGLSTEDAGAAWGVVGSGKGM